MHVKFWKTWIIAYELGYGIAHYFAEMLSKTIISVCPSKYKWSIDKVNATRQFDRLNVTHNFRGSCI